MYNEINSPADRRLDRPDSLIKSSWPHIIRPLARPLGNIVSRGDRRDRPAQPKASAEG